MREANANETSGELGLAFGGYFLPLVSVDLEYHDVWCAFKSWCPVSFY